MLTFTKLNKFVREQVKAKGNESTKSSVRSEELGLEVLVLTTLLLG